MYTNNGGRDVKKVMIALALIILAGALFGEEIVYR